MAGPSRSQILVILFWLTPFFQPAASLTLPWWFSNPFIPPPPSAGGSDNSTLPTNSSSLTNTTLPSNNTIPIMNTTLLSLNSTTVSVKIELPNTHTAQDTPVGPTHSVVPGPGMPSLDTMGLISTDLFDSAFAKRAYDAYEKDTGHVPDTDLGLQPRDDDVFCPREKFSSFSDVRACGLYLMLLGDQMCEPSLDGSIMCSVPGGSELDTFVLGAGTAPVRCGDVGTAITQILATCQECGRFISQRGCVVNGARQVTQDFRVLVQWNDLFLDNFQ